MAATTPATAKVVHRTARVRLRLTRLQAQRCYRLLRAAGDVWAWLLDSNRSRLGEGGQPVANYQALCRDLAQLDSFEELSTVGARSVLRRYSDAWFQAAKRRNQQQVANFPRRKRSLIPVCYHHGTLQIRALRAESYLHLGDQRARSAKAAGRAPKPGQYGSRRWRRHRIPARRAEARHRRRIHQAQHEAAKQVVAFAVQHQVGTLLIGDPKGITSQNAGRLQNLRRRQWRRTHLVQALRDKAERASIVVRLVDERGTRSTCPACRQRVPKPSGRRFSCPHCQFQGHRDLVGAYNIAAKHGGGPTSTAPPVLVEHRRAGIVPARRDRRRHLQDQRRRRRSCLASGLSAKHACSPERRSPAAISSRRRGSSNLAH